MGGTTVAKGTPNPVVTLSRSRGATELSIPSLSNTVVSLSFTVAADTQALPALLEPARLVRVACSEDCYIRWDSSATDASSTDTLMIRGVEPQRVPEGATHVSAIRESTDGVMTITMFL
jgi:hypothetical protein